MAALADDEEVAAQLLDSDTPTTPSPPLTDFDPTVRALADLYDRVGELIDATYAVASGKKPKGRRPYPRPRTAVDRLRERRRWAKHKSLTDRLLRRRRPE